ncbi:MAG: gliding motility-associated ABC transporter permease subunit GldF [Bacteroidia bacterium]|nr:gliding motility-associated ABC transporter permease subunit GldF [Bacteroidia bacterium]
MYTISKKEIATFFNSLIAYIVIIVFLTGIGLFFWVLGDHVLLTGNADLSTLFDLGPWLFLFLVPAITMRSFAEEYKTGTIEFLRTKPITDWEIVLGKYLASVSLVVFSLLPTMIYYLSIYYLGNPVGNIDSGATWGAYLGLLGIGAVFAAIGIFASTLTDNQIVAFIIGVFLCFILYFSFDFLAELEIFGEYTDTIVSIGLLEHYRSISRGVIDSRDVIYYLSIIFIALLAGKTVFTTKR